MNAIDLLEEQHDEVEDLFEKFEKAEESAEKREIFIELADNISAHAAIEEKIFYPAVYVGEMKELLQEAVEEHLAAKRIIADLLDMDAGDEQFSAKVKVLEEQIEHHVEEEEDDLFKKVRANFAKEELESMGMQMEAMFEQLKNGEAREQVPAETEQAAPLE